MSSLTATSHALLRGEAAPPVQEEPTEPVERAAEPDWSPITRQLRRRYYRP